MFDKLSGFEKRIVVGKTIGFIVGLLGFFLLPFIWPAADKMTLFGILFWYTTFGVIIGLFGVIDHHPMWKKWKFGPCFRGIFMGAWLNFVLVFFAYEKMEAIMASLGCASMTSPWWFVVEGIIVGVLIDLVATKYGGEGSKIF